jgi:hypothetical protein
MNIIVDNRNCNTIIEDSEFKESYIYVYVLQWNDTINES